MIKKEDIKGIVIIALFYLFIESIGITCPIKFLTGISCAGCGMSRAYVSLLKGDIVMAFHYHPLFMLPPVLLLSLTFKNKMTDKLFKVTISICVILFVIVYVFRLIDTSDDIVVCAINNGIIYKAVEYIASTLGFK